MVPAAGSGGTAAGLAVGLAAAGVGCPVVAVRASSPGTSSPARLAAASRAVAALARRLDETFPEVRAVPEIEGRELGAGYGWSTRAGLHAIEIANLAHFSVEPVYSAKALAAVARQTGT